VISATHIASTDVLRIFNFAAALSAAFLVDRLGRRTLFTWSGIGMLVSYIVWTACSAVNARSGNTSAGIVVIVCLFTFFFHYDIGEIQHCSLQRHLADSKQRTLLF
jgi:quinol-cytochrome oxidoreductase complex cytochrome b subunit